MEIGGLCSPIFVVKTVFTFLDYADSCKNGYASKSHLKAILDDFALGRIFYRKSNFWG